MCRFYRLGIKQNSCIALIIEFTDESYFESYFGDLVWNMLWVTWSGLVHFLLINIDETCLETALHFKFSPLTFYLQ